MQLLEGREQRVQDLQGFHQEDGTGYKLVTDWLIKLDTINPQTTARVCTVFDNWKFAKF